MIQIVSSFVSHDTNEVLYRCDDGIFKALPCPTTTIVTHEGSDIDAQENTGRKEGQFV